MNPGHTAATSSWPVVDKRTATVTDPPWPASAACSDASTWNGISVPSGTPRVIIDRLQGEIAKILRAPNTAERLAVDGSVAVGSTPEEFVAYIKTEHAKWGKVVREANIRVE